MRAPTETPVVTAAGAPVLVVTKLQPPPLRSGHVRRPALVERLEDGSRRRLTVIRAPAGSGKTSLLAEWVDAAHGQRPFAWLSLDREDDDPTRFWTYVLEALRSSGLPVPEDAVAAVSVPGARPADVVLPRLINALATAPGDGVLVLDDLHLVTSAAVHAELAYLVERMPAQLHVVLASREEPPADVPLPRLRVRGELTELGPADLRFDDEEAAALLRDGIGRAPDLADVERLQSQMEGWAAGLYLAALSLRSGECCADAGAPALQDRHLSDYLASEMLATEAPGGREFLLRTSILERMCGPLCDALLEVTDSAETLLRMERSNLLVVPLDRRGVWFRYHHLLADLLRAELQRAVPEQEVATLHRRAAHWWQEHGEPSEAIRHALAAGADGEAARLINRSWTPYLRRGHVATVVGWFQALPRKRLRSEPDLLLARGWLALELGDRDHAERLATAAESVPGGTPAPVLRRAAGLRAASAYMGGDLTAAAARARRALVDGTPHEDWHAVALATLGSTLHYLGAPTDEVAATLDACLASAETGNSVYTAMRAITRLALLRAESGDRADAERLLERARALAEAERIPAAPHSAWLSWVATGPRLVTGTLLRLDGDLEGARDAFAEAAELATHSHVAPEQLHARILAAEAAALAGDVTGAREAAAAARRVLARCPDAGVLAHALAAAERLAGGSTRALAGPLDELTERELGVLRMLSSSMSQREIASTLYVSPNTLKTHVRSIYRKLGVAGRVEATGRARELGLL